MDCLRDHGDPAGSPGGRHTHNILPPDRNLPPFRWEDPAGGPDQRGFPNTVGTHYRKHLARSDGEFDVFQDRPAGVAESYLAELERSCYQKTSCLALLSSQRKNGAPATAVMMPTGRSRGARTVRATASAANRTAPPPIVAKGIKRR